MAAAETHRTAIRVEQTSGLIRCRSSGQALVPRVLQRTPSSARIALTAGYSILHTGDHLALDVVVGPGCLLEIVETGGTVAYPTPSSSSSWRTRIEVGPAATLLWNALPLVIASGARVTRATTLSMHPTARALLRETIVLGRSGEVGGQVTVIQDARYDDGSPIASERLDVDGSAPSPVVLGRQRVLDAVQVFGVRPPEAALSSRVMTMEQPAAIDRFVGDQTHDSDIPDTWTAWRTLVLEGDRGTDAAGSQSAVPASAPPRGGTVRGRTTIHSEAMAAAEHAARTAPTTPGSDGPSMPTTGAMIPAAPNAAAPSRDAAVPASA